MFCVKALVRETPNLWYPGAARSMLVELTPQGGSRQGPSPPGPCIAKQCYLHYRDLNVLNSGRVLICGLPVKVNKG